VRLLVEDGKLSSGHARALLGPTDSVGLATLVIAHDLNVRQTERLVKSHREGAPRLRRPPKDADTRALERDLTERLGSRFRSTRVAKAHGHYRYQTLEQLDLILARLRAEMRRRSLATISRLAFAAAPGRRSPTVHAGRGPRPASPFSCNPSRRA